MITVSLSDRCKLLALTAPVALHVDLRTLLGRDDPLRLPRPRRSDTVQLALQHGSGLGHSRVAAAPGRGRAPQDGVDGFHQSPGNFSERHDGEVQDLMWLPTCTSS